MNKNGKSGKEGIGRRDFCKKVGLGAAGVVAGSTLAKLNPRNVLAEEPTKKLPKRKLGRNGLMASTLSIGAGSRFTQDRFLPDSDREEYLAYVLDQGVNYIDTAINYGPSEGMLGEMLTDNDWDKLILSTKTATNSYDGVMEDYRTSVRRLKREYFDVYLLHESALRNDVDGNAGAFRSMQELRESGAVGNIGYSSHARLSSEMAVKLAKEFDLDHSILTLSPWDDYTDYSDTISDVVDEGCTVSAFKLARYVENRGLGSGVEENFRKALEKPITSAILCHSNVGEGVTWKDVLESNLKVARDFGE